jgi:hypothetical protein
VEAEALNLGLYSPEHKIIEIIIRNDRLAEKINW